MISLYVFRLSFRTSATIFITFSCSPSPLTTTWGSAMKARPLATRSWSVVATPSDLSVTIEWWAVGTASRQRHLRSHFSKDSFARTQFWPLNAMNGIVWASPYHLSLSLSLSLSPLISLSHLSFSSLSLCLSVFLNICTEVQSDKCIRCWWVWIHTNWRWIWGHYFIMALWVCVCVVRGGGR